jgi:hypothetical protein
MTMTLIETKTLGAAAAAIEFTSIPQDATDLLVLMSFRSVSGAIASGITLKFNGSSASFAARRMFGDGSTAYGDANLGLFILNGPTSTSNSFSNVSLYVPNYAGSTNKSFSADGVQETNGTTAYSGLVAGVWSNTAAITSITLSDEAVVNLAIGSTASLYKITKGSSGGVVVS